jgi:hypothetical protein
LRQVGFGRLQRLLDGVDVGQPAGDVAVLVEEVLEEVLGVRVVEVLPAWPSM